MNISLRLAIYLFLSLPLASGSSWAAVDADLYASEMCMAHVENDLSDHSFLDGMEPEIRQRIENLVTIVDPVYNPYVRSYLRTYIEKYPAKTEEMLGRTTIYFPLFERLLRENDMPEELKFLAIIESSLVQKATSRSGAVGLWQFMKPTGREYGLRVTKYVDERMDPEKATRSAVRYLKYLYKRFQSWELAMAAYNAGPGRVNSAIKRSGTRNYWKLAKYLPRETRSYVPGFIAAMYVYNHHGNHGMQIKHPSADFINTAKVRVHKGISFQQISQVTAVPISYLRTMNAKFVRNYVPQSVLGHDIILPDYTTDYLLQYLNAPDAVAISYKNFNPILVDGATYEEREVSHTYRVRKGDNLYTLAQHNNCSVADLKSWNGLSTSRINIGQPLNIYYREMVLVTPKKRPVRVVQPLFTNSAIHSQEQGLLIPEFDLPLQSLRLLHKSEKVVIKRRHGLRTQLMLKGIQNADEVMQVNGINSAEDIQPGKVLIVAQ